MAEDIRLGLSVALLICGLVIEVTAVFGANRFRFSLNRMHSAGMGDTLGLMLIAVAAILYLGWDAGGLKIALIVAVYWITSPVCTHMLGRMVKETGEERLKTEAKEWKS